MRVFLEMREITEEEYLNFISHHRRVVIDDVEISLEPVEVKRFEPTADELTDISTTVWSFPKRGAWATHRGDYRGNWPPQIPRALIEMFTEPGDLVVDPMSGSGTTCIEAVLLGRNCIAVDINYHAAILTYHRLYWLKRAVERGGTLLDFIGTERRLGWFRVFHGDARNLDKIDDESAELVATHPPYLNIIQYGGTPGDLSGAGNLEEYLRMIKQVAREAYRVLKPDGVFAVLVGDTRAHKYYIPVSTYVLLALLDVGFALREEVVKVQHRMKKTREVWRRLRERDFLLIYHEKLFILQKLRDITKVRLSLMPSFINIRI